MTSQRPFFKKPYWSFAYVYYHWIMRVKFLKWRNENSQIDDEPQKKTFAIYSHSYVPFKPKLLLGKCVISDVKTILLVNKLKHTIDVVTIILTRHTNPKLYKVFIVIRRI